MAAEAFIRRCRDWYGKLLRLYPKPYRERFGEGMEQTFNDLCRERVKSKRGLWSFALWMFVETAVGIVRENLTQMTMKRLLKKPSVWLPVVLLSIPLTAMLFRIEGWHWGVFDFVIMGAILSGAGFAYEFVARHAGTVWYRVAAGLALTAAVLLVWMNGAVGIIGDKDNASNPMYFGVLAIGMVGAALARFRPRGMARALFAMALAQALVPVMALMIWNPQVTSWSPGVLAVFALHGFFVLLFAGSGLMFRRAS